MTRLEGSGRLLVLAVLAAISSSCHEDVTGLRELSLAEQTGCGLGFASGQAD